jgi:hypothetical protein
VLLPIDSVNIKKPIVPLNEDKPTVLGLVAIMRKVNEANYGMLHTSLPPCVSRSFHGVQQIDV